MEHRAAETTGPAECESRVYASQKHSQYQKANSNRTVRNQPNVTETDSIRSKQKNPRRPGNSALSNAKHDNSIRRLLLKGSMGKRAIMNGKTSVNTKTKTIRHSERSAAALSNGYFNWKTNSVIPRAKVLKQCFGIAPYRKLYKDLSDQSLFDSAFTYIIFVDIETVDTPKSTNSHIQFIPHIKEISFIVYKRHKFMDTYVLEEPVWEQSYIETGNTHQDQLALQQIFEHVLEYFIFQKSVCQSSVIPLTSAQKTVHIVEVEPDALPSVSSASLNSTRTNNTNPINKVFIVAHNGFLYDFRIIIPIFLQLLPTPELQKTFTEHVALIDSMVWLRNILKLPSYKNEVVFETNISLYPAYTFLLQRFHSAYEDCKSMSVWFKYLLVNNLYCKKIVRRYDTDNTHGIQQKFIKLMKPCVPNEILGLRVSQFIHVLCASTS